MSNNIVNICSYKNTIFNILTAMEDMKKIVDSRNKIARIVLEETVAVNWTQIKKMVKQLESFLPNLQNTVLWNVTSMQDLIVFTESKLRNSKKSPCEFVDFVEELLRQENIERNIRFLKYVTKDNIRCQRVFREIKTQ